MIQRWFLFLVAAVFLFSCSSEKHEAVTLKIIHTTDVHGTIFPYDFIKNKPINNSIASVYTFVKEQRKIYGDKVILLDNGDYLQGQPTVYYYNFEDTTIAHLGAKVFNFMNYDAATVGNHDIETGHAVYDKFRKEIDMPYLAANAVDKNTGKPYFEPYTIIHRAGVKVAVLGLITPGIPDWLPENLWEGMEFLDMVETAEKWVKVIQEKENPDLLIGMFHAGIDHTYDNPKGDVHMNQNASMLVAEKVPGFDIILAGHDHKKYNEKVVNVAGDTVLLVDAKSHSRYVSDISVTFIFDKKIQKYAKQIHADLKKTEGLEPDAEFLKTFSVEYETIKNYVSQQIGEFSKPLDSKESYFGNSRFMDFIHQVQLETTGADVSFTAPLAFRQRIEKGPVYISDLFKLYKYENLLYTMSFSGEEIDQFLEYSVSGWFNQMKSPKDHLLKLGQGDDGKARLLGKYYNFSSASGIDYLVDVSKPSGNQVKILGLSNGKPFYPDSTYSVAVNSYRGNGGGGHFTNGVGLTKEELRKRLISATDTDIRFLIMNWIKDKKVITPKKASNWRIIPEDDYEFGKKRDMELLFGEGN